MADVQSARTGNVCFHNEPHEHGFARPLRNNAALFDVWGHRTLLITSMFTGSKTRKAVHQGTFDGYGVIGRLHSLDELHHGWHTSSWPDEVGVPIHHYWVQDGKLLEIALDGDDHIEPGGEADVKPAEKEAVLKAVGTWGKP